MTYEELAAHFGVRLCPDCQDFGDEAHQRGTSTIDTVHWRPRGIKRRGIWNFLKLVATVAWGLNGKAFIERIWHQNELAYDYGLDVGIRFPREYADNDRALVRAYLAAGYGDSLDEETHRRIVRWARDQ